MNEREVCSRPKDGSSFEFFDIKIAAGVIQAAAEPYIWPENLLKGKAVGLRERMGIGCGGKRR